MSFDSVIAKNQSRRALRALKALVKIQALVRGHISRKQAADNLRRMQALLRVQARARAGRILISEAQHWTTKSSDHLNHTVRDASFLGLYTYLSFHLEGLLLLPIDSSGKFF